MFRVEDARLTLLFGLVAFGQIEMRKITGYKHVAELQDKSCDRAKANRFPDMIKDFLDWATKEKSAAAAK